MTLLIGTYVSPYVRKVLVALALKQVPYEIDPLVPFYADDQFLELSPLRRVPVLVDDRVTISDSTVICEYLNERYPDVPLLPDSPADRARARWLEEFADTRLGDLLIWRLFYQRGVGPTLFGQATDEATVARTLETDLPAAMDYLESHSPEAGFLFGDRLSAADIAIACPFKNAIFVRWRPDPARWPKAAGLIGRVLAHDAFRALEAFETLSLKTPPTEHREGLRALGAPIAAKSFIGDRPRRGVMPLG